MHSFKKAAAVVVIAGLMAPAFASAQTSTTSLQTLLDQIKALQAQIQTAQQQKQAAIGQLLTTLKQGDKGENVRLLQQLLASDPTLYPEGTISGTFGPRTAAAIKRFQKKFGIEQAGNVGPKTLRKLNEIFGHRMGMGGMMGSSTPGMMGSSTMGHPVKQHDDDDDDDDRPCDDNNGKHLGWFIGRGNKDKEHECRGGNGNQGTTTPPVTDTVAPIITAVVSGAVATTTATITWTTNENATGKVYFGTANPLVLASATANSTTTLSAAHSFVLTGLSASTTYYYVVESKDAANNTTTSGQSSFTTTN